MHSNVISNVVILSFLFAASFVCVYNFSTYSSYNSSIFNITSSALRMNNPSTIAPPNNRRTSLNIAPATSRTVLAPPSRKSNTIEISPRNSTVAAPPPRNRLVSGPVRTPVVSDPVTTKPIISEPITSRKIVAELITPKPFVDYTARDYIISNTSSTNASVGDSYPATTSTPFVSSPTSPSIEPIPTVSTQSTRPSDSRSRYEYTTVRTRPRTCTYPPPSPVNRARSWPMILPATYCYGDFLQYYATLNQVEAVGSDLQLRFSDDSHKTIFPHRRKSSCDQSIECIRFSWETDRDFLSRDVLKTYDMCDAHISTESFVIVDDEQNCIPRHGYKLPAAFLPDSRRKSL